MDITYYRQPRPGPEALLVETLAQGRPQYIPSSVYNVWLAGSLPVGAGFPDLVVATYRPDLLKLHSGKPLNARLLSYLRMVRRAKSTTVALRLRQSSNRVDEALEDLLSAGAVTEANDVFTLSPTWREILPELTTIEAKMHNWKGAAQQAARNCLFVHRSFVAFPIDLARRVHDHQLFKQLSVGVLGVDQAGSAIHVFREAPRKVPILWPYYYEVALEVSASSGRVTNAVHSPN